MVDEQKVRLMTSAEMARKKDIRATVTAGSFFGSDFVAFQVLKGVLGVIIVFVIVAFGLFVANAEAILTGYTLDELYQLLKIMLIIFVAVVAATAILTGMVYTSSYWKARAGRSEYRACLRRLDEYYHNNTQGQDGE